MSKKAPAMIRMELKVEGEAPVLIDVTPHPGQMERIKNPSLLFEDFAKSTPKYAATELARWEVRRPGEIFKGLGSELGPELRAGDLVVLRARRKPS